MWLAWLSGLGRSRCLFELHILGSMQTKRFSILSDMASHPVSGRVSGRACVTSLALAVVWGAVRGPLLRRADALFRWRHRWYVPGGPAVHSGCLSCGRKRHEVPWRFAAPFLDCPSGDLPAWSMAYLLFPVQTRRTCQLWWNEKGVPILNGREPSADTSVLLWHVWVPAGL